MLFLIILKISSLRTQTLTSLLRINNNFWRGVGTKTKRRITHIFTYVVFRAFVVFGQFDLKNIKALRLLFLKGILMMYAWPCQFLRVASKFVLLFI